MPNVLYLFRKQCSASPCTAGVTATASSNWPVTNPSFFSMFFPRGRFYRQLFKEKVYSNGEHKAGPDPIFLHQLFKWEVQFQGSFWIITITIKRHLSASSQVVLKEEDKTTQSCLQAHFKESRRHNLFFSENCQT